MARHEIPGSDEVQAHELTETCRCRPRCYGHRVVHHPFETPTAGGMAVPEVTAAAAADGQQTGTPDRRP